MASVGSLEIVTQRMVWAFVFSLLIVLMMREWRAFSQHIKERAILPRMFAASVLISINWGIYIWAVNAGHIVETAMGYFINPLLNVVFGFVLFKERLKPVQILAVALAALGVLHQIFEFGRVPWIALALAFSFGSYGALKKSTNIPAAQGVLFETGFALLPALAYLIYLGANNAGSFPHDLRLSLLFIFGGAVTLSPLLFFAAAAKRISFTALGMFQYLGPTIQLLLGVFLYHEPFGSKQFISFGLIWMALLIYSVDQFNARRRRKIAAPVKTCAT